MSGPYPYGVVLFRRRGVIGQSDKVIHACFVEHSQLYRRLQRQLSLAALIFRVQGLIAHKYFSDLLLCQIRVLPQIPNP